MAHPPPPPPLSQNRLLAQVSGDTARRLLPQLEYIALPLGQVLQELGSPVRAVYFPTSAIVSLLHIMQNGASSEVATVGREGMIGTALVLDRDESANRVVVQSAGHGYRLPGYALRDACQQDVAFQRQLLHYVQLVLSQTAQTAICNRHHSLEQQFCRWLLHCADRLGSGELVLTQELIANLLGARRESISEVASNAQRAGLIRYHRGKITLLDREGLAARACECYAVVKQSLGLD
ncbi:Crp/Fnr family transcriptional regulator [Denitratisoma sp. agr-D3]